MSIYSSKLYNQEVALAATKDIGWEKLQNKSLAISGGTGMIGSFLVDVIIYRNEIFAQNTDVYVLGRSYEKAKVRFDKYIENDKLHFVECDINNNDELQDRLPSNIDFIIHAASNTHPRAYSTDPIGTITANVIGTSNLLEWGKRAGCVRFEFLSSVEIYGENKGDTDKFKEEYLGYINCNTLRAGYPESKRVGEAMCQAYISQENMDIVIPRLSRVYGPTMLKSDTKALSQFILKGVKGQDIVLKSEGTQEYSYSYVLDAVTAMMYILVNGTCGEVYNVASQDSDIRLRDLADIIASYSGSKVVFELPDDVEKAGYSTATKATLDISKLMDIGFKPDYDIKTGLEHTIEILKELQNSNRV